MTADLRADIEARALGERLAKMAADIIRGGQDNVWRARVALRGYNDLIAAAAILAAHPAVPAKVDVANGWMPTTDEVETAWVMAQEGMVWERQDAFRRWLASAHPTVESAGVGLIAAERRRQVEAEGYTAEHDAGHATELAMAAACYAIPTLSGRGLWPWAPDYWKPTPGDRVRELVKAGALIAAAIDAASSERAGRTT